ncbi:MAG: helix-turn-helix transcriptional regulator [Clostridia bacterium]|nr:helix-turn-helix transcriptional regulator [Clostridia bacterium]
MEKEDFINRLVRLRMNKGVSARDMSLSLGQNPGYINNIENGKNFPTMQGFFYICQYFQITPKEFFDTETTDPPKIHELVEITKDLSFEQLNLIIKLIKSFKGKK